MDWPIRKYVPRYYGDGHPNHPAIRWVKWVHCDYYPNKGCVGYWYEWCVANIWTNHWNMEELLN